MGEEGGDLRSAFTAALLSAAGLCVVAVAYDGARQELGWAGLAYWLGMALLVLPILTTAVSSRPSRSQRLALTLLLTLMLYGVKVLHGPLEFEFHDELQHWRTTVDIVATGGLFTPNALLPISPAFPGLEIVTQALMAVTGLSAEVAGTTVAGLSKLVLAAALFWLFERLTQSARLAMMATLVYAANPHFVFFSSMYAYATLGLTLMVLAFVLLHRWSIWAGSLGAAPYRLVTMLTLAALAITHHLTSFVALVLLAAWTAVTFLRRLPRRFRMPPLEATLFLAATTFGWQVLAGAQSLSYLNAIVSGATEALLGQSASSAAPPPLDRPAWEWLASAATVGLITLAIPIGAWRLRLRPLDPLGIVLILLAGGYYLGIVARFLPGGAELAGRSWSFTYLGAALAVASGFALTLMVSPTARRRWLILPLMSLLFLGGSAMGYPPHWARLPGPYLVSAFERSIEPEGIEAARWQAEQFGRDGRVATDFTNHTLSGSYGFQDPVVLAYPVYFAPAIGGEELALLEALAVDRLLVDLRLCGGVPQIGYYIVGSEPNAHGYEEPMDCGLLTKFEDHPAFERIYDGGSIRIYDVEPGAGADGG